ncbi:hypothetical protein K503DRAFT_582661 [Rhizopogon vinicolor AM-OR11-026]|uniref:Bromodomain associated domain-containing protein n=1 Tax=Rhizopogon vinicolor AM-OR11-026 TaxID=1314800 RepID=A0A1B7N7C7_9AGAM|nr:hypothetical protein K503DRAFT_582661 [Rhizopogon vinicolor AM-OR11-026]
MASQAAAAAVLDSVVLKVLHAHNFSRTSSQASVVLTNLVSRYLILLSSVSGSYSELSGRSKVNIWDVLSSLGDLGVTLEELDEYSISEGKELGRYASSSTRRLDDLLEFRSYLEDGHEDDAIPLLDFDMEDLPDMEDSLDEDWLSDLYRHTTPDILPPFPDDTARPRSISPAPTPSPVKLEKPPSLIPQHISSNTVSDYVTQVDYSESVLASTPEWHLPSRPPASAPSQKQPPRLPTPQTEHALIQAYHHILTHSVPPPAPPNPAKHKVATTLLTQVQNNPRWDSPDTLYANIVPCPPRIAAIGPSYPVAQSTLDDIRAGKDDKEGDKKPIFPSAPPRPVFSSDKPVFLVSQQSSRLPDLARQILAPSVLARTTRLAHPPVLQRGNQKLYYGTGISAPWNSSASGGPPGAKGKDDGVPNGRGNEPPTFTLPDAQMFATWDFEAKRPQEPLVVRRGRGLPAAGLTLSMGNRKG